MKKYLNLDKEDQEKLTLTFPNILLIESCLGEHGYQVLSVSVFDHWLSKSEAIILLNDVDAEEDLKRKNLHYNLNKEMVTSLDAITYRIKGKKNNKRPVFKKFINLIAAWNYVTPSNHNIPEKFYFKLVFPTLGCIYYEGNDYTNHLYYKNQSDIEEILTLIKKSGLFILS